MINSDNKHAMMMFSIFMPRGLRLNDQPQPAIRPASLSPPRHTTHTQKTNPSDSCVAHSLQEYTIHSRVMASILSTFSLTHTQKNPSKIFNLSMSITDTDRYVLSGGILLFEILGQFGNLNVIYAHYRLPVLRTRYGGNIIYTFSRIFPECDTRCAVHLYTES